MSDKIDIREFLIIALGSNSFLYEEIDRIYEENKLEYYDCYKKSNYVDDKMFQRFTAIKYEYIKKCTGIIQWDYLHQTNEHTYALIKKGYKSIWNYCKNKNSINLEDFSTYYINKKGGHDKISELDIIYSWIIAIYLCTEEKIKYYTNSQMGMAVNKGLKSMLSDCSIYERNFSDEKIDQYKEEIEQLYDKYNIPMKKYQTIDDLLETIIVKQTDSMYKGTGVSNVLYMRSETLKKGISKYIGALGRWIRMLGIHDMDLTSSCVITKKDIDVILMNYLMTKKEVDLLETDEELFIISEIWIKALAEEYKKTKSIYLNKAQDEFYYHFHNIKEELEQKDKELRNKEELLKAENLKMQQENDNLWEELKKLQRQCNDYKNQINTIENNNKEVFALREYVFSKENNLDTEENIGTDSLDMMIKYLRSKKCAIIGGHSVWINRMKEVLPNFIFMNPDDINKDIKFVDNVEAVFINTLVNSHAFYEKVMSKMSRNDTKLFYIDNTTNINLSIKVIYDSLSKS